MEQQIDNFDAGYRHLVSLFQSEGIILLGTTPINGSRYIICETTKGNFLVAYKRDFYLSFGKEFKDEGATGIGETINCESLKICIQKDVSRIYFIYPNGNIYSILLPDFLNNSFRRVNKENKATRSISIHLLKREN